MEGDIVGVSSFGLCNSFSHLILKQNNKCKKTSYEKGETFADGLPRLILVSGRNEEGVKQLIMHVKNTRMDEEFCALLQSVFYKSMTAHYNRSYCILPDNNEENEVEISVWVRFSRKLFSSIHKLLFTVSPSCN